MEMKFSEVLEAVERGEISPESYVSWEEEEIHQGIHYDEGMLERALEEHWGFASDLSTIVLDEHLWQHADVEFLYGDCESTSSFFRVLYLEQAVIDNMLAECGDEERAQLAELVGGEITEESLLKLFEEDRTQAACEWKVSYAEQHLECDRTAEKRYFFEYPIETWDHKRGEMTLRFGWRVKISELLAVVESATDEMFGSDFIKSIQDREVEVHCD